MIEKPIYFVRSFYRLLGLKLQKFGKNANRRYKINQKSLALMNRILLRRQENILKGKAA
jgi:hypothetical protein